jgi:lactoylglutathione lyase
MLRVSDLDRSIDFYCQILGMEEVRRESFSDSRFTLVFIGYQSEQEASVIELTYNWDEGSFVRGNQFGHIALEVDSFEEINELFSECGISYLREPGPMKSKNDAGDHPETIAFIEDPDGNILELIEKK